MKSNDANVHVGALSISERASSRPPHLKPALFLALGTITSAGSAFAQQTFGGYDCTEDCSGHKAGYEWAEQNNVTSTSDCTTNSQSFNEGCDAYVDDPDRGADEDDDGNEIEE
ncbi:hypothetical protein ACFWXH_04735 [Mesorhizobium sp. NPDC059054]|uniref:hypothetical protein n=1 Tax=Mesorhizobium sp. NPDC059054 TaxID=3346711 RepID=UPI003698390B